MTKLKAPQLGLKGKLTMFVGLLLVVTVAVLSTLAYVNLDAAYDTAIADKMGQYDTEIKTAVISMVSMLDVNYKRFQDGEITEAEALASAEKLVRDTRYDGGNGYFWADMADGKCAVHMNPEYEGTNRYDAQDLQGTYYIRNLITAGDEPEGAFTEFYFTKPGEDGSFKKRAFTLKFEPYGWYISTGNYYDDIDAAIQAQEWQKMLAEGILVVSSLVIAVLGLILMRVWARRIANPITAVSKRLSLLAEGDLQTTSVSIIHSRDETGLLTQATDQLIASMRGMIGDIAQNLQNMAQGDMSQLTDYDYIGDFSPIKASLTEIHTSLNRTLSIIESSAEQVRAGAAQVSLGAQTLASGSSEQAGAVEELSSSVSHVSDTANKNAEHATDAAQHARQAALRIEESNAQMGRMLEAMERISASSGKINEITDMIESISFQTNILALNAAIEAARAGNAGKGFAVVADEVRNLAAKSSEAVQQAQALVSTSMEAVTDGAQITKEMADMISSSLRETELIKTTVLRINDASTTQAQAIEQITQGVEQISIVVQSNAATAEQSSASSEELSAQATILYQELAKFKLTRE